MHSYKIIVSKSTVPVGTAEIIKEKIKLNFKGRFDVVSNPEFLREGVAVGDFMKPERVIIGTESEDAKTKMKSLYEPFVRQGNPIIFMDLRSAEMTKYAANSFLATKISFMNEIANLWETWASYIVRKGIGSDSRIGNRFLFPGIGFGGSCFPKDVKALAKSAHKVNYDFKILNSVISVNEIQKTVLIKKIKKFYNQDLNKKKFAIWGLSFKPNTDDIREAPSLEIINSLLENNCEVNVFDPEAMKNVRQIYGKKINFFENQYECLEDVDALIMRKWVNSEANFKIIQKKMKRQVIFDGRNIFEPSLIHNLGFKYFSIGR